MKYIIPETISEKWINRRRPKDFIPGYKFERLIYAIHCIAQKLNMSNNLTKEGIPIVRLHSKLLKKRLGCHYNKYFEFLQKKNVITISDSYQEHIESKGYAFTKSFMVEMKVIDFGDKTSQLLPKGQEKQSNTEDAKFKAMAISHLVEGGDEEIDVDVLMINNNEKMIGKGDGICPFIKSFAVLGEWDRWYNDKLVLDKDGAKKAIEKEREYLLLNPQTKRRNITYIDRKTGKPRKRSILMKIDPGNVHSCASSQIANFQVRDFKPVHRDKTIGRLFSTMVKTSKVIRPYLTYDGEQMGYLDIKNCQPFLITALVNPCFWQTDIPYLAREYDKFKFCKETGTTNIQEIGYAEYLFPNTAKGKVRYKGVLQAVKQLQGKDDTHSYLNSVITGTFYKDMENLILEIGETGLVTKEFVKDAVFTVLFTANQFIGAKDAAPKRRFRDIYPSIYKLLAAIKSGKGNKSLLSRLLQRLESHIMIDGVATHLTQRYPDIPFYPIHDAIAMPIRHRDLIKEMMIVFVKKNTGHTPAIHEEVWGVQDSATLPITPNLSPKLLFDRVSLTKTG